MVGSWTKAKLLRRMWRSSKRAGAKGVPRTCLGPAQECRRVCVHRGRGGWMWMARR